MNILINAAQSIEKYGKITIKTYVHDKEVVVSVSDTGCGISDDDMAHIFDPFFSTKPVGKGTGLGLSAVKGIIENHKGNIEVRSEVGRGTTVVVKLPVASKEGRAVRVS